MQHGVGRLVRQHLLQGGPEARLYGLRRLVQVGWEEKAGAPGTSKRFSWMPPLRTAQIVCPLA